MKNTMEISKETFWLAIIGSGILSTIINIGASWIKEFLNNKKLESKRLLDIKENAYKEIVKNIDFVYKSADLSDQEKKEKRNNFLLNYRLMFLYSSDEVVREINNILNALTIQSVHDTEEMKIKKKKISHGMVILRRQIIKNTELTEEDFEHIT